MAKTLDELRLEWAGIDKNWYSVYQWKSLANSTYGELIAPMILDDFDKIKLNTTGLRKGNFQLSSHQGQSQLQTEISQFTEKRFVHAMFNAHHERPIIPLGTVLDYEVPLKAQRSSRHGDIDLLCRQKSGMLIIEVKQFNSTEGILKAFLQAMVYSSLVGTVKSAFTSAFDLPDEIAIVPAVLTFDSAESGRQIRKHNCYPNTMRLLNRLNDGLLAENIEKIRFFSVTNSELQLSTCLSTKPYDANSKLVLFKDGFALSIEEVTIS